VLGLFNIIDTTVCLRARCIIRKVHTSVRTESDMAGYEIECVGVVDYHWLPRQEARVVYFKESPTKVVDEVEILQMKWAQKLRSLGFLVS